jgi:hypothetical protein
MARTGAIHSERFGFELLIWIAAACSRELPHFARGAALVMTTAMAAKAWVSARLLASEIGKWWAIAATPVVISLPPITLDWEPIRRPFGFSSPVHLGRMSGLILHNPATFTVLFFPEMRRRGDRAFAWGIFLVVFLQYALLRITGPVYSGNWSWGRYLAIYPIFLLCLARFVDVCCRPGAWRPGWRLLAQGILVLLLSLHFSSGLRYFWQALRMQRF